MALTITPLTGIPKIHEGESLVPLIITAMERCSSRVGDGDIIVIAQKIISKSEGRLVQLASIEPQEEAISLAKETDKDPRLVQLILDESDEVVRSREGVIIVAHRIGLVHANAGIDRSNIEGNGKSVV